MLKVLAVIAVVGGIWLMLNSSPLGFLVALAAAIYLVATEKSAGNLNGQNPLLHFKDINLSGKGLEISYVLGEDTVNISTKKKHFSFDDSKESLLDFQGTVPLLNENLNPNISLEIQEEQGEQTYVPGTYTGYDSNGKPIILTGGKGSFYHPSTGRYLVNLSFGFEGKRIYIKYFTKQSESQEIKSIFDKVNNQANMKSNELKQIKERRANLAKEQKRQAEEHAKQAAVIARKAYVSKTLLEEGFSDTQTYSVTTAKPDGTLSELLAVNKDGLGLFIDNSGDKWVGSLANAVSSMEENALKLKLHDEEYRASQLKERRFTLLADHSKDLIMEWVDRINIIAEQLQKK